MIHSVQIVDFLQVSDGQLGLMVECCGDVSTRSSLTLAAIVVLDTVRCQSSLAQHCQKVATQHQAMLSAKAIVPQLIGTVTQITLPDPAPVIPADPSAPTDPAAPADPGTTTPAPDPSGQIAGS
jgi:hypothetical protein